MSPDLPPTARPKRSVGEDSTLNRDRTKRRRISGTSRARGPHISLDRRAYPRFPAADDRVWLGWWATDSRFAAVAARLVDVSRGGARLMVAEPPPAADYVWIRSADPQASCVQGEVLEVSRPDRGDFVARVRFLDGCPDDFFDLVTRG